MKKPRKIIGAAFLVFLCIASLSVTRAQRKTTERRPAGPGSMIKESSIDYQLWEGFTLVRKANAGEPAAQHELGIRYLQGKGFEADTVKAAFWLVKAAEQDFDLAHYNLAILAMNGWGMPWDPFVSYRYFLKAAKKGMPEAQFIVGLIFTENLVVPQNWSEAYRYVKMAADAEFDPAKKALVEFQRRQAADSTDSPGKNRADDKTRPLFIDFNVDTTSEIDERTLINELAREAGPELKKALGVADGKDPAAIADTSAFAMIERAADAGSPEAMSLLGRFHEKGLGFKRDPILASVYYTRAMRLESGRARELLWNLVQEPGYIQNLEKLSKADDPRAQYVWVGLVGAGIDQRLSGEQAFVLLQKAANHGSVDALIEMGLCYQSGRWTKPDRPKGRELWRMASNKGSQEAAIRLEAQRLFSSDGSDDLDPTIRFFESEAQEGSILAQVALGYCYETGRGVPRRKGDAARLYRNAAQRGSQSAYAALRRMHDEIRPPDKEFQIPF